MVATPLRAMKGTCVDDQIVTLSPCHCATTAWGSIGTACDMSASYRSLTTMSAFSMAASASPLTMVDREQMLPSRTTSSEPS